MFQIVSKASGLTWNHARAGQSFDSFEAAQSAAANQFTPGENWTDPRPTPPEVAPRVWSVGVTGWRNSEGGVSAGDEIFIVASDAEVRKRF